MDDNKFHTVRGYQLLGKSKNKLTPSLEDYLEMIYRNISERGYIRVNELASKLNVRPSSVSKMVNKLASLGFLDYEKYGAIKLTKEGFEIGAYLIWRHNVIRDFFLLISRQKSNTMLKETELVEHSLSRDTVKSLEDILILFKDNPTLSDKLKNMNI